MKWERDKWTTKERTDSSIVETIRMLGFHNFLNYYRNIAKEIDTSQVQIWLTNKSVAILEASRRTLSIKCVKISVLTKVKKKKYCDVACYSDIRRRRSRICCVDRIPHTKQTTTSSFLSSATPSHWQFIAGH